MKRFLHKAQVVVFLDGDDVRRAPMAAAVFDSVVKRDPILKIWDIRVYSAGTGEFTVDGAPPHHLAVLAMHNLGLNIAPHKASALSLAMLKEASIVVAMEHKHVNYVEKRFSIGYLGYCTKIVTLLPYLNADFKIESLIGAEGITEYTQFAKALNDTYCPRLANIIAYETLRPLLLKGTGLSTGAVQGKVKLVKASTQASAFEPGDIMVSPSSKEVQPYLQGHIRSAGGIIIDSALENHNMMQLGHELIKTPCIIGTVTAMQLLKDGQMVTMDATTGSVYGEVDAWYADE
jgi:phosphohistidine swiveling domain-containing protein/protein-tyrosine-phosphatase